jgi:hypothetical protein
MQLIDKIFSNPDNRAFLNFYKLVSKEGLRFKVGENSGSPFDEGSQVFFFKYAENIPNEAKVSLSIYNLLVNPASGQIFAFQHGRFTFLVRADFQSSEIHNHDKLRKGGTLDGFVDFSALGENWCLLNVFIEEETEVIDLAYQLSMRME